MKRGSKSQKFPKIETDESIFPMQAKLKLFEMNVLIIIAIQKEIGAIKI